MFREQLAKRIEPLHGFLYDFVYYKFKVNRAQNKHFCIVIWKHVYVYH